MHEPDTFDSAPPSPAELQALAVGDLRGAIGWVALGIAVLIGSVTMDRLENQGVNPYTVPGLLPGLLGIAMILLGTLLAMRSWRRKGTATLGSGMRPDPAEWRRLALVLCLILVFAVLLVGHGLPFWLAAAIYVTASILILQLPQRRALGRTLRLRDIAFALAVGLGSGLVITYVFQELFLVRLP
ncbi:MAG: tripartite tricarboxylate transporter TctB family protein [Caldimonas sp.]